MTLTVKDWRDYPDTTTPLSAAAMEDVETRVKTEIESVGFRNYREYRPEDYGAVGNGSTDDSTAFKNLMSAIQTSGVGGDIVLDSAKTYVLDGTPDHTKSGNAIVPLPLLGGALDAAHPSGYPYAPQSLDIRIRSLGRGTATLKTTRTGDAYSATYGSPSMIGGPTPEQIGTGVANVNVRIEGVLFIVPANPKISCLDLWGVADAKIDGLSIISTETSRATQVTGPNSVTQCTNKWVFGLRLPYDFNMGTVIAKDVFIHGGPYVGIVMSASHAQIRATIQLVVLAFGVQTTSLGSTHTSQLMYSIVNLCKYGFAGWDETAGATSLSGGGHFYLNGGKLCLEDATTVGGTSWTFTALLLDANDRFHGEIEYTNWNGSQWLSLPTVTGGANFNFRRASVDYVHSAKGFKATGPANGGAYFQATATALQGAFQTLLAEGDANAAWGVLGGGIMGWGAGGASAQDTTISRASAGVLNMPRQVIDLANANTTGIVINDPGALGAPFQLTKATGDANASFQIFQDTGDLYWGAGGATAVDVRLYRAAANQLRTTDTFIADDGITTKVKAGTPVDGDFATAPPSGTIVVDTTASKIWVRIGSTWKQTVALT